MQDQNAQRILPIPDPVVLECTRLLMEVLSVIHAQMVIQLVKRLLRQTISLLLDT